jgi:hypothetical protein
MRNLSKNHEKVNQSEISTNEFQGFIGGSTRRPSRLCDAETAH